MIEQNECKRCESSRQSARKTTLYDFESLCVFLLVMRVTLLSLSRV